MALDVIIADGVSYVPEDTSGDKQLVVIDGGYMFIGRLTRKGDDCTIREAKCLIQWGTTKHLAELRHGPLEGTKLGDPCTIRVSCEKIRFVMEVIQDAW